MNKVHLLARTYVNSRRVHPVVAVRVVAGYAGVARLVGRLVGPRRRLRRYVRRHLRLDC